MRHQQLLLTIMTAFLFCLPSMGQTEFAFRNITASNGLPNNNISGVFIVPDGRLGFRTTALLGLYDGCKYTSFPYPGRQLYSL